MFQTHSRDHVEILSRTDTRFNGVGIYMIRIAYPIYFD